MLRHLLVIPSIVLVCADVISQEQGHVFREFSIRAVAGKDEALSDREELRGWLATNSHDDLVREDPSAIYLFNWLPRSNSDSRTRRIAWMPHVIPPKPLGYRTILSVTLSSSSVYPLFSQAEANRQSLDLVELVPIDTTERYFAASVMIPESIRKHAGDETNSLLIYEIQPGHAREYSAWTKSIVSENIAYIIDGKCFGSMGLLGESNTWGVIQTRPGETDAFLDCLIANSKGKSVRKDKETATIALDLVERHPVDARFSIAWSRILQSSSEVDRQIEAALMIGKFGSKSCACVPVMIDSLRNLVDSPVRRAIINALGLIGSCAREALPLLRELQEDESKGVAASATKAIKSISNH